jgi:hypothetical protein
MLARCQSLEWPARKEMKLTLDTNVIMDLFCDRQNRHLTEVLIELARKGRIDLVVTRRIRADIHRDPLAERLNELPGLLIRETGIAFRLGESTFGGPDMFAPQAFDEFLKSEEFKQIEQELIADGKLKPGKRPDPRDWVHIQSHHLQRRDMFLTWDRGIWAWSNILTVEFGITIMSPKEFLNGLGSGQDWLKGSFDLSGSRP